MTRRVWFTSLFAALAALGLASCRQKERPLSSGVAQPPSVASRVWVMESDAIILDQQHIRLSNAYGPQSIPDAHCWAEALASKLAIQKIKDIVRSAVSIEVTPTGGRDEYNRIYATVTIDRLDLGVTLFQQGLAAQPTKGRFEWCNPISLKGQGAPDWQAYGENGRP